MHIATLKGVTKKLRTPLRVERYGSFTRKRENSRAARAQWRRQNDRR